jgi:hypothetical protein
MKSTILQSLRGRTLTVNVPGRNADTIRFRIVGFSADELRVQTLHGKRSTIPIRELETLLDDGTLVLD